MDVIVELAVLIDRLERILLRGGLRLRIASGPKPAGDTLTMPKCKAREAERVFTEWGQEPQDEDERRMLQHHVDG